MPAQLVDAWIARVYALPARDQVRCVLLALRRCAPIAARWFDTEKLGAPFRDYASCLNDWLKGKATDGALEKAARPLDRRLNREVESERDLSGAMAAHAFLDTEAIALGYSPEVGDEIVRTAVLFAGASFTGSPNVPIEVDPEYLSPAEIAFIDEWWRECGEALPALRD